MIDTYFLKDGEIRLDMQKSTSLSRCFLLAEMVGFEPTCPIKDKTISSL